MSGIDYRIESIGLLFMLCFLCFESLAMLALLCSTSIRLMLDCNCSMVSSRIAISSRKSSFLRSNDFILPLPKRELTPLASAVAASVVLNTLLFRFRLIILAFFRKFGTLNLFVYLCSNPYIRPL